ncbi:hypothetical protein SLA2020_246900 [Shorea laevis]
MPLSAQNGGVRRPQTKIFVCHVLSGRMFMVLGILWIISVNGSGCMFGLYSNEIKSSLGYDQTTLNLLSFFKDLGGTLGILAGLVYENPSVTQLPVYPPSYPLVSIWNFLGRVTAGYASEVLLTKYKLIPPFHSPHIRNPLILHRPFLDRLCRAKFPLLCVHDDRVLSRSATATALCNHIR